LKIPLREKTANLFDHDIQGNKISKVIQTWNQNCQKQLEKGLTNNSMPTNYTSNDQKSIAMDKMPLRSG
jgi:hypothetical protein